MIITVTGHRWEKLGGFGEEAQSKVFDFAQDTLAKVITSLHPAMNDKPLIITGMAQGWDIAIAAACIELRLPYLAAIPFNGQEKTWPQPAQDYYWWLVNNATERQVIADGSDYRIAYLKRDEWMVDQADQVIALWDGKPHGGTAHTVKYAKRQGVPVHNVWKHWQKFLKGKSLLEEVSDDLSRPTLVV